MMDGWMDGLTALDFTADDGYVAYTWCPRTPSQHRFVDDVQRSSMCIKMLQLNGSKA